MENKLINLDNEYYDLNLNEFKYCFNNHNDRVNSIGISKNEDFIVSSSQDGTIR